MLLDHCLGIHVDQQNRAWMWGSAWVAFINLEENLPVPNVPKRKRESFSNKARSHAITADGDEEAATELVTTSNASLKGKFWITLKYRPLLMFDLMNDTELVVVERPTMDMLSEADIPPPFYAKEYGNG
jgi:U3 small nucleolar RNA-associated protein 4